MHDRAVVSDGDEAAAAPGDVEQDLSGGARRGNEAAALPHQSPLHGAGDGRHGVLRGALRLCATRLRGGLDGLRCSVADRLGPAHQDGAVVADRDETHAIPDDVAETDSRRAVGCPLPRVPVGALHDHAAFPHGDETTAAPGDTVQVGELRYGARFLPTITVAAVECAGSDGDESLSVLGDACE